VHRLEIQNRQLRESLDYQEGAISMLRARWKGDRGGRPPKQQEKNLRDMTHEELRQVLLHKPPSPHQERLNGLTD